MDLLDPYSTAWLEPPSAPLNTDKISESPKKANFFSKAGKIRLQRIWDDNQLDVERLFTGITEPSEAFVREKVSDYVQHYLFQRTRRSSLVRKTIGLGGFGKERKLFWEYEDFISAKNLKHDQIRRNQEVERLTELLITGRAKYAPDGFAQIFEDPIFKVNRLMDSVRKLEHSEINVTMIPFEIRTTKIRRVNEVSPKALCFDLNSTSGDICDYAEENPTCNSDVFSPESLQFQEIPVTPISISSNLGTPGILSSAVSPGGGRGYFVEFPTSEYERDRSFSIISDLSDQELSAFAEKRFANEDITGDLEISAQFSYEHAPIALIKKQSDCSTMYKIASDIVQMFQRQEVAGDEFIEYLNLNHFNGK